MQQKQFRHRYTKSSTSTTACSPLSTPLSNSHSLYRQQSYMQKQNIFRNTTIMTNENNIPFKMSLNISPQKLRDKSKEQQIKFSRNKWVRKQKCSISNMQNIHKYHNHNNKNNRKEVNWIIYNMLVSIYANWLRLAPYVLYYLGQTKMDKIRDIDQTIKNVLIDKQRIQKLLKMHKNSSNGMNNNKKYQMFTNLSQNIDDKLLNKVLLMSKQIKISTQLLNGQFLSKTRNIKTQKQNILADNLFTDMKKHSQKYHQNMIVNDQMQKVAETIVDRIAIVNYLRKNNRKVNQEIMKPLKNIFSNEKSINQNENMTTDKILQKIKHKFMNLLSKTKQNKQNNGTDNAKQAPTIINQTTKQLEGDQNIQQQRQPRGSHNSSQSQNRSSEEGNFQFNERKTKKHKKIGFIFQDDIIQDDRIRSNYRDGLKGKTTYEFHSTKRVLLDRELKRLKMRTIINDIKNSLAEKKDQQMANKLSMNQQKSLKLKQTQQKFQKDKLSLNIPQTQSNQKSSNSNKKLISKRVSQKSRQQNQKKTDRNNESQNQQQSSQQSIKTMKYNNGKSKKHLKHGKLLKKKAFKKFSNLYDKIDLQNFDLDLQAEDNIVNKKKKIIELFNTLQASGIITTKSIKKIMNSAIRLNLKSKNGRNLSLKRQNQSDDIPLTSLAVIPQPQKQRSSEHCNLSCHPYTFLTSFNKQAIEHWKADNYDYTTAKIHTPLHISRYSGMDCDLNIPIIKKQAKYRGQAKWFDKESQAIQMSLAIIRKINMLAVKQTALNQQKQQQLCL